MKIKRVTGRNDDERENWVRNHEGLCHEWQRRKMGIRRFIREYRAVIDEVIRLEMEKKGHGA